MVEINNCQAKGVEINENKKTRQKILNWMTNGGACVCGISTVKSR